MNKYQVIGVDSATGQECKIEIDAENMPSAVNLAREKGIFVSKIDPLYTSGLATSRDESNVTEPVIPPVPETSLINIFYGLGAIIILVAIGIGIFVSYFNNPIPGVAVILNGIVFGLLSIAISRILAYLEYAAQRLRDVNVLLQKQSEK